MKKTNFSWKCGTYPKKDIVLLAPALFGFLVFYLIPFIWSIHYAMSDSVFSHAFIGLENFAKVWNNNYYRIALGNSIVLALALPFCILPITLMLALLMRKSPGMIKLKKIFLLPTFMPVSAIANVWLLIFTRRKAWAMDLAFDNLFFHGRQITSWLCMFTLALWKNTGIPLILLLENLLSIDIEQEQASSLDGANNLQRFRYIIFPQMKAILLFILVYLIMVSQKLFREAYVLYGSYPEKSIYMVQHYMNNHFTKLDYSSLSSGAIILTLIIMGLMLPCLQLFRHVQEEC